MKDKAKNKNKRLYMPGEAEFFKRLQARQRRGHLGKAFNYFSIGVAALALIVLFLTVVNEAFGAIGVVNTIEPQTLTGGRPLEALESRELAQILADHAGGRLRVLIRDTISQVDVDDFTRATVAEIVADPGVDAEIADQLLKNISRQQQADLLANYASPAALRQLVMEKVVQQQVIASFACRGDLQL